MALVVALACAAAVALPESSALAAGTWSPGVEAPLPAGAGANPQVYLASVSCVSPGNCTAGGEYVDSSGNYDSLLVNESSGTWNTGVEVSPPANSSNPPSSGLGPVSCPSAGNCTAVGSYSDSAQNYQGMMVQESSGTWDAAVEAPLPANAASDPYADPDAISCPSAGNCSAVGTYIDASGNTQGVVYDETSGTWTAEEAPLPADATSNPQVFLPSVSCASAGNCSAVGMYYNTSGDLVPLTLDETSGTWSAAVPSSLPPNAGQYFNVFDVSCVSAGNCNAVGSYVTDDENVMEIEPLLLAETSGTWTAAEGPVPADAATVDGGAQLRDVSCPSAGDCVATGGYIDTSNNDQGLLLVESAGTWSLADAPLPANASPGPNASFGAVSCASAGNCTAVGGYNDTSGNTQALLLDESAGTWSTEEAALPANAGSNPDAGLNSVSCASAGNCSVVGGYSDASGNSLGLLLTENAPSGAPPPTVTRVFPTSGPANTTTDVTLTGTQFGQATAVDFGSTPASFSVVSNTSIKVTAPSEAAGAVPVTVTTPSGVSTAKTVDHFTYEAPSVTNVSPNTGSVAGGTTVTISGTLLSGASAVTFGGVPATNVTQISPTSITAVSPPGAAGVTNVRVTAAAGTSATVAADHFTYVVPAVTYVKPSSGPPAGGTWIIVGGPQLTGATAVDFGSEPAYFSVYSSTALLVLVPPGTAGVVNVRVTTPAGQTAKVAADHYTYT